MQMTDAGHAPIEAPRPWDRQAVLIVLLCFVLNMVDGMDILILSYIAPALQSEWGVDTGQLGIVFSSGLAGMALGGIGLAPLADRVGRRRMIAVAMAMMALGMVASSFAHSVTQLALIRLVVGTGIGTVLACIAAVAARVAPPQHRNFAVGILQGGYPIGAMITGFVTAWALPLFGWRHMMMGAAVVSALCVPLVLAIIPAHLEADADDSPAPLREVIAGPRLRNTVLLVAATISGFMALYFITSWITKLSIAAGLAQTNAIVASAIYNFGAFVGTLMMSVIGTRFDIRKIVSNLLLAAIVVFLVFGGVHMALPAVLFAAFIMGVTLQGGYNGMYPIAAHVYPDKVRATGIGWVFGVGRIGAFCGPLLGGWALAQNIPLVGVFAIFCVPLFIAAMAARNIRFAHAG